MIDICIAEITSFLPESFSEETLFVRGCREIDSVRLAKVEVPPAIKEIRTAPVVHDTVCGKDEMKQTVEKILGL